MNKKQSLLSICIPTYNRRDILSQSLQSIVTSNGFDETIEIAISDNNSDDGTEELIKDYQKKYPNNFIYQKNIPACSADENFIRAMQLGNGKFLKLNNDYYAFLEGTLSYLINIVKEHEKNKTLLMFTNGYLPKKRWNKQEIIHGHGLDDLVNIVSYWTTWISIYGYWKEDFDALPQKDRYSYLHLNIVDWIMRNIEQKNEFIIYNKKIFIGLALDKKSGWYNIFEVFLDNYYFILSEYVDKGKLSKRTFIRDRKTIFPFIQNWSIQLLAKNNKNLNFNTHNAWKIIWKYYRTYYKLYALILKVIAIKLTKIIGIYGFLHSIKLKIWK